jgi:hypothetical protein
MKKKNPEQIIRRGNRHPADALADVRAEIKQLERREEELRAELLLVGANLIGIEWGATVHSREHRSLNKDALVKHFGREALAPFFRVTGYEAVALKKRSQQENSL